MEETEGGSGRGYKVCLRCGKLAPLAGSYCTACGADLRAPSSPGREGCMDVAGFKASREPRAQPPRPGASPQPQAQPGYRKPSPPAPRQPYASYQGPWRYETTTPGHRVPGSVPPQPAGGGYQGGYQGPAVYQQGPSYAPRKTEIMALASLLCAAASFFLLPLIPAVAAVILGYAARDRIRRSAGTLEGEGMATAGIVIGIINVVLVLGLITAAVVLSLYQATLLLPFMPGM